MKDGDPVFYSLEVKKYGPVYEPLPFLKLQDQSIVSLTHKKALSLIQNVNLNLITHRQTGTVI